MVTISRNYHHWHSSRRQFKQYLKKKKFLEHVLSDYNRRNYLTAVGQRMPPLLPIACHLLFEILQQSEEFSLSLYRTVSAKYLLQFKAVIFCFHNSGGMEA